MTKKQTIVEQAKLANLSDPDLLNFIGHLWQTIKDIDEAMADDPQIEEMTEDLKEYKEETYLTRKSALQGQLKAARILAKQKGLKFKLPGDVNE